MYIGERAMLNAGDAAAAAAAMEASRNALRERAHYEQHLLRRMRGGELAYAMLTYADVC